MGPVKQQIAPTVPSAAASEAPALLKRIRACSLCTDLPLGARPILQFDQSARILVASQAPGRRAHASGVPFDDPSGERLRYWLGVDRDQFYDPGLFAIVPLGMCYPGTGPQGDFAPKALCAQTWRHQLLAQLREVPLTLAIGRHAIEWHCPEARRRNLAEIVQAPGPQLIALPHPSPRNNRWLKANPWFEQQLIPQLRDRVRALLG